MIVTLDCRLDKGISIVTMSDLKWLINDMTMEANKTNKLKQTSKNET